MIGSVPRTLSHREYNSHMQVCLLVSVALAIDGRDRPRDVYLRCICVCLLYTC
jgi:hypothetical protein